MGKQAYPSPPLFLCTPTSASPCACPPATCAGLVLPPAFVRNRGTLGGARKVRPPFPFITAPAHAHRQRAWGSSPPPPLFPTPVYTHRCTGTRCPTPFPPFRMPPHSPRAECRGAAKEGGYVYGQRGGACTTGRGGALATGRGAQGAHEWEGGSTCTPPVRARAQWEGGGEIGRAHV